ncbi:hypothetical protein BH11ACT4_BH11ACT4_01250 [soil metagenome]
MRISWGRVWLSLGAVVALALVVGFTLKYLGVF